MYFIVNKENFVIAASEKFLQNIGARDICLISSMYRDGSISIDDDSKSIKALSQNLDYTFESSKLYSAFGELTHYRLYDKDEKVTQSDNKSDDISHLKQIKESAPTIVDDEYKAPTIEKMLSNDSELNNSMNPTKAKHQSVEADTKVDTTIEENITGTIASEKTGAGETIEIQDLQRLDEKKSTEIDIDLNNESAIKNNIPPIPLNRLKRKRKTSNIETSEKINNTSNDLLNSETKIEEEKFITITLEKKDSETGKLDAEDKKRQSIFPWKKDKKTKNIESKQEEIDIEGSLLTELENIDITEYKNNEKKELDDKVNISGNEFQNKEDALNSKLKNENKLLDSNPYNKAKEIDRIDEKKSINIKPIKNETKKSITDSETIENFQNNSTLKQDEIKPLNTIDDKYIQNKNDIEKNTTIKKNTTIAIKIKSDDDTIDEDNETQTIAPIEENINENIISARNIDTSNKDENITIINLDNNAKKLNLDIDSYKMLLSSYIDETLKVEDKLYNKDTKTIDMLTDAAQLLALDSLLTKLNDLKNSEPEKVENCTKSIKKHISSLQDILNSDKIDIHEKKAQNSFSKTEENITKDTITTEESVKSSKNDNKTKAKSKKSNLENIGNKINNETISDIDLIKSVPAENITLDIDATSQELNLPAVLISEFIKDFLEQAKEHLPILIDAQEKEDIDKLQSTAHMLKGAANNLRLSLIGDTLLNIQKSNEFATSKELVYKFASLIKGLEIALKDVESI